MHVRMYELEHTNAYMYAINVNVTSSDGQGSPQDRHGRATSTLGAWCLKKIYLINYLHDAHLFCDYSLHMTYAYVYHQCPICIRHHKARLSDLTE